jgi:cell division protein ZapA
MDEPKNIVNATILNEEYTLAGDQPIEKLENIIHYVDQKMREINRRLPMASYKKVAVLAALNIAEELIVAKENDKSPLIADRVDIILKKLEEF